MVANPCKSMPASEPSRAFSEGVGEGAPAAGRSAWPAGAQARTGTFRPPRALGYRGKPSPTTLHSRTTPTMPLSSRGPSRRLRVNRQRSRAFAVASGLSTCGLAVAVVLTGAVRARFSDRHSGTRGQRHQRHGRRPGDQSGAAQRPPARSPDHDYVHPGSKAELLFVAVNESPAAPIAWCPSPPTSARSRSPGTRPSAPRAPSSSARPTASPARWTRARTPPPSRPRSR